MNNVKAGLLRPQYISYYMMLASPHTLLCRHAIEKLTGKDDLPLYIVEKTFMSFLHPNWDGTVLYLSRG